jgi:hypothetical protein
VTRALSCVNIFALFFQKRRKKSAIPAFGAFLSGYFCACSAKTRAKQRNFRPAARPVT